eukprot:NODE_2695_length_654_cov_48.560331_g2223_i0.p1 GENE.NODE_2695_length_654_cov_48.560331_g2223_i0~~NODE_2695_length_654_cov_48.560331_g2223_i0.p1  ORF type:complete len:170 (-),score=25.23 NODE_2695_length_654_cov_48.560331_g2223_i0:92-601(-)
MAEALFAWGEACLTCNAEEFEALLFNFGGLSLTAAQHDELARRATTEAGFAVCLGMLLANGLCGYECDTGRAAELLQVGDCGHALAQAALCVLQEDQAGAVERSTRLFEAAYDRGSGWAAFKLGEHYNYHAGPACDPLQAVLWYQRALERPPFADQETARAELLRLTSN